MNYKEAYLRKMHEVYGGIIVFGVGNNAEILVEYFEKDIISKYVDCFMVSIHNKCQQFYDLNVVGYNEVDAVYKNKMVIVAVDEGIKNEVFSLLTAEGFINCIYLKDIFNQSFNGLAEAYYSYFIHNKPLFRYIEIETINRCNGVCEFCAVNKNEKQRPYKKMSSELFHSIINQLVELNYEGHLNLFSNNEPFIDDRIIEFAKFAREKLQNAYICLYTNGTLLTEEKFVNIMPYLNKMQVDLYITDGNMEMPTYIEDICAIAEKRGWSNRLWVQMISSDLVRGSRGGSSPNSKVNYSLDKKCSLPMVQMVVRPDGKISLCCNDALGKITLGDVSKESLSDVWYSEKRLKVVELIHKSRKNNCLCEFCNTEEDKRIPWDDCLWTSTKHIEREREK